MFRLEANSRSLCLSCRINQYVRCFDKYALDPLLPHQRCIGPLFNVFAFKFGSSEIPHVDQGDSWQTYAIVYTAGDFTGGEFVAATIDFHIPIPGGSILLVNARKLIHKTAPFDGTRFVVTGFIDFLTAKHAGVMHHKFMDLDDEAFTIWLEDRVKCQLWYLSRGRKVPKAEIREKASEKAKRQRVEDREAGIIPVRASAKKQAVVAEEEDREDLVHRGCVRCDTAQLGEQLGRGYRKKIQRTPWVAKS